MFKFLIQLTYYSLNKATQENWYKSTHPISFNKLIQTLSLLYNILFKKNSDLRVIITFKRTCTQKISASIKKLIQWYTFKVSNGLACIKYCACHLKMKTTSQSLIYLVILKCKLDFWTWIKKMIQSTHSLCLCTFVSIFFQKGVTFLKHIMKPRPLGVLSHTSCLHKSTQCYFCIKNLLDAPIWCILSS